ncbi:MAG: hypothetical protein HPM95_12645 [Alphaproteobacteria bacterium]|nr:hypothetical protein [Alphaproteobacteria bacterium]
MKTAIVLSGSVKLLIGLAVLLVGVLGLAARLRRGFAGVQAARGTSHVRRWAAICIFAFGIGVALHGVPRHLADLAGSGAHALAGLRIEGTVEDRRGITDPQTGDVRYYLLDVSFCRRSAALDENPQGGCGNGRRSSTRPHGRAGSSDLRSAGRSPRRNAEELRWACSGPFWRAVFILSVSGAFSATGRQERRRDPERAPCDRRASFQGAGLTGFGRRGAGR